MSEGAEDRNYVVAQGTDPISLEKAVNAMMKDGFIPHGSLQVVTLETGTFLLQPMIDFFHKVEIYTGDPLELEGLSCEVTNPEGCAFWVDAS